MRTPFKNSYAPAVAFAVLALAGGLSIKASENASTDKLYKSQLAACERGNILRSENNNRIKAHEADKEALKAFLERAQQAREDAFEADGKKADEDAAKAYGMLRVKLDQQVNFSPVKIVNCKEVVPEP